jgi:hypothetical protein
MTERRKSPRLRTFKGGTISHAGGLIDCTIRNLSDGGACVEVVNPGLVPDAFALIIKPELLRRSCRVLWREANRIGVEFV